MNILNIAKIINLPISEEQKRELILVEIARDKDAIPTVMKILANEREQNSELIRDMNLELSRAHIFIDDYMPEPVKLRKGESEEKGFNRKFITDKIAEFYINYKDAVTHCFNRFKD